MGMHETSVAKSKAKDRPARHSVRSMYVANGSMAAWCSWAGTCSVMHPQSDSHLIHPLGAELALVTAGRKDEAHVSSKKGKNGARLT